jgi:hypothetical protein
MDEKKKPPIQKRRNTSKRGDFEWLLIKKVSKISAMRPFQKTYENMKIKRKDRRFSSNAVIIFLCIFGSQLIFQCCSDENDLLTESPAPGPSIVNDSKSYFDSLVVVSMDNRTDLSNTLSPGEITPLWEDAYLEANNNYEYKCTNSQPVPFCSA